VECLVSGHESNRFWQKNDQSVIPRVHCFSVSNLQDSLHILESYTLSLPHNLTRSKLTRLPTWKLTRHNPGTMSVFRGGTGEHGVKISALLHISGVFFRGLVGAPTTMAAHHDRSLNSAWYDCSKPIVEPNHRESSRYPAILLRNMWNLQTTIPYWKTMLVWSHATLRNYLKDFAVSVYISQYFSCMRQWSFSILSSYS